MRRHRTRGLQRQLPRRATRWRARRSCRSPPTARSACRASNPVDVVVDITGVFDADGELRFVPTDPTADARHAQRHAVAGRRSTAAGRRSTSRVVPPEARAVTGTITLVGPLRAGWLAAYPCGPEPTRRRAVNAGTDDGLRQRRHGRRRRRRTDVRQGPVGDAHAVRRHRLVGAVTRARAALALARPARRVVGSIVSSSITADGRRAAEIAAAVAAGLHDHRLGRARLRERDARPPSDPGGSSRSTAMPASSPRRWRASTSARG